MKKKKIAGKTITEDDVRYVANLSRLRLDDGEIVTFKDQLAGILGYIEQLNEVDVENVLPTTHVLSSMKNVFREDVLRESIPPEEALQNAPSKKDNFFKVPKIIKDA
ncbi:MAG: Asp-tRNA(Asn)/Glu-tRNA(Gln) amidotransferase subunit GatC [Candidatus Omnitrophica bacterium]|nr:Asp-tRNA(Asn)/Glu-tRNA(Gln) amidotransferase subunit GatC [Candidatus Omnitrophota bacterium]